MDRCEQVLKKVRSNGLAIGDVNLLGDKDLSSNKGFFSSVFSNKNLLNSNDYRRDHIFLLYRSKLLKEQLRIKQEEEKKNRQEKRKQKIVQQFKSTLLSQDWLSLDQRKRKNILANTLAGLMGINVYEHSSKSIKFLLCELSGCDSDHIETLYKWCRNLEQQKQLGLLENKQLILSKNDIILAINMVKNGLKLDEVMPGLEEIDQHDVNEDEHSTYTMK